MAHPTDLSVRRITPELMDDPKLATADLAVALRELSWLNRLSISAAPIVAKISTMARARKLQQFEICDLACGSGDVLCAVARGLQAQGFAVSAIGLDINENSIQICRERASSLAAPCTFKVANVVAGELPQASDFFISSLFLHHLTAVEVTQLLSKTQRQARHGVVITDLIRSRLGYALAWLSTRVLCSSKVVRHDALRSVEGAFTIPEARLLCQDAGLGSAKLSRIWPERFLLHWDRDRPR